MRIRFHERLDGTYWAATSGDHVVLAVAGEEPKTIGRTITSYTDHGVRAIELRAEVGMKAWSFTFVREDTILPNRDFLVPPPPESPF
jgi:hypothetical protein